MRDRGVANCRCLVWGKKGSLWWNKLGHITIGKKGKKNTGNIRCWKMLDQRLEAGSRRVTSVSKAIKTNANMTDFALVKGRRLRDKVLRQMASCFSVRCGVRSPSKRGEAGVTLMAWWLRRKANEEQENSCKESWSQQQLEPQRLRVETGTYWIDPRLGDFRKVIMERRKLRYWESQEYGVWNRDWIEEEVKS